MAPDMVHRDEGDSQGQGTGLGEVHPHQHRADESGGIGHGHGIDLLPADARRFNGLLGQDGDGLHMAAGGDLRHNAAVDGMELSLGKDLIGQNPSAVLHNGNGGFITGGFKSKYFQVLRLISKNVSSV